MFTVEYLHEILDYDPETGMFRWKVKVAHCIKIGSIAGAISKNGYRLIAIKHVKFYAHRLAWFYIYGAWPTEDTDHINGLKDDNRISNLRCATRSQNNVNSINRKSATGIRGVYPNLGTGRPYYACIGKNHLGYFDNLEEAAEVYRAAAIKIYGEFIRTEKQLDT